jgi:hypothetical protein
MLPKQLHVPAAPRNRPSRWVCTLTPELPVRRWLLQRGLRRLLRMLEGVSGSDLHKARELRELLARYA